MADDDSTVNLRAALTALMERLSGEIKHLELAGILRAKRDELQALLDDLPETQNEEERQTLASKIQLERATLDALVGVDQKAADLKAEQLAFINRLLFETPGGQRFTQDSPILPSVLIDFALEPRRQLELILTLKGDEGAGHASMRLRQMIKAYRTKLSKNDASFKREKPRISYIPGQIAVRLYFDEMMRVVLPLTPWWHDIYTRLRVLEKKYQEEPAGIASASWYGFPMPDDDRRRDIFEALMVMRREIDPGADNILEDENQAKDIVKKFQLDAAGTAAAEERIKNERNKTRLEYVQQFPQELSWFVRVIGLIADCFKSGRQLLQDPDGMSAVLKRDFDARRDSMNSSLIETKQEQATRIADQATSLFEARQNRENIAGAFLELYAGWLDLSDFDPKNVDFDSNNRFPHEQMIWRITKNRPVHLAVTDSALTIKADAARRLFDVSCEKITWAILDSGIDEGHPAFRNTTESHEAIKLKEIQREMQDDLREQRAKQRKARGRKKETEAQAKERDEKLDKKLREIERNRQKLKPEKLDSRVVQTLDFTKLRNLLEHELDFEDTGRKSSKMSQEVLARRDTIIQEIANRMDTAKSSRSRLRKAERILNDLRERIAKGYDINWRDLEDAIVVNHPEQPSNDHGTHVAGILGADWIEDFENEQELPLATRSRKLQGICPEINLIDVRVFREDGLTDEFELLAAIQFLRWMNERAGSMKVHGANLSISLLHEVQLFACGQTPICNECNEASALGMVMVAAAGNRGFTQENRREIKQSDHYQSVSVTDPGNADSVITVGATHRKRPHEYGVSYFSSRGPTGDGRMKPDLVAPGEKIMGPTPNKRMEVKDGTSMAAPHVSGAAAMLMARHTELIGNPVRIKQILCETATDLGRERYFQGHGLVDALRALQSV